MRKATNARIITRVPVYTTVETQFGPVKQKTNRFQPVVRYSRPGCDQLMTAKEKEIRKAIKKLKGDKSKSYEVTQLRLELHKILNPPVEV